MEFSYDSNNPTHGILWYLYNNPQIVYSSTVFTKATSEISGGHSSRYAIDFNSNLYWTAISGKPPGEYITISTVFPISLKGYLIQTSNLGPNSCHPKVWAFASSKDGINFVNNQTFEDTEGQMNDALRFQYVPFHCRMHKFFRISVTGISYCNENRIDLNQAEFFGTLHENTCFCDNSKKKKKKISSSG